MATYENDVLIQTKDKNGNINIHYPITMGANVLMSDGQTAEEAVGEHVANKSNPHGVTAAQVGAVPTTRKVNNKALSADITLSASDVSAVPTTRKVNNKALSADITLSASDVGAAASEHGHDAATTSAAGFMSASDKSKLDGIATGANKTTVDSALSSTSTNPVQNKVINTALAGKSDSGHGHDASEVTGLATVATSGNYNDLSNKPTIPAAYSHPTSSGNKHIPSGGSSGQILRWSADGTAAWGADNNTTYGVVSTTADGLAPKRDGSTTKFLRADGTWAVPPDNDTKYTLPNATSSTLGGVKIGSNISVSDGTISVPTASGTQAGVTIVYPAASCTTFSSDTGTVTPLAVQKGAKMFSITRPASSTNKAITRYSNTTGDVQDSKIIIEDVTNSRDTSKTAQVIAIPAEGGKKMVYGYCTDQIDGTSFIGGVFDADATAYPYSEGLAIGGTSGNLLWKGAKVATVNDIPSTSSLAPKASPTFTGTPKAPTAAAGTNTTQIATTAFVQAAISTMQATIDSLTARIAALEADDITFEESEV